MTDARDRYGAAHLRYIAAYQESASPARLHLALALADTAWNPPDRDRLTVLDIGCGRGLTACLLAAANPGWDVIGLDLQPVHVAEAEEVAAEAGLANARFIEADLAELDAAAWERLLPPVDVVICHGVWTWVPDAVREGIVRLLRARLAPGGLLLVGYNALPGYADCIALQRLLFEASRRASGGEAGQAAAGLAMLEHLRDMGCPYLPRRGVLEQIIATAREAPAYMAHEWFTPFWRPVFHADLARDLAAAGLEYGGTARPGVSAPALQLRADQRAILDGLVPSMTQETAADVLLERRFRSDIFVRGRRTGGLTALPGIVFAGIELPPTPRIEVTTQRGPLALEGPPAEAILAALAAGPVRLGDLAARSGLSAADIAVMLLDSRIAVPLWRDAPLHAAGHARAARCNAVMLRRFGGESLAGPRPLGAVAPSLGGAIGVPVSTLSLLVALQSGVPAEADRLAAHLGRSVAEIDSLLTRHAGAWRDIFRL
ncbi:methyltransferase domain-containing protein [Roseomonas sp. JC162]|uniref:Methyltransferase domain-containing protein n=1 Tax=Neoroseomonas marina TaxID=1232220 RepID=A0A848E9M0_9PROT|nr:class I SAM-dependent methyltransferase [Neoroseomonas marina]NMJ39935.1 methyltransferase domain-containing protein [Neoroseomonas marina]